MRAHPCGWSPRHSPTLKKLAGGPWSLSPRPSAPTENPRMGGTVSILVLSGGETGGRGNSTEFIAIVLGRENRQEEGGRWGMGGEGTQSS